MPDYFRTLSLTGILLAVLSFSGLPRQFVIEGVVTGFPDHTKMYLSDLTGGAYSDVDSAVVINGRFQFKGQLNLPVQHIAIHNADFSERCTFWAEPRHMFFSAEKGKFREAVIKGSSTQDEYSFLQKAGEAATDNTAVEKEFIRKHPNSIISPYLLSVYLGSWKKDTIVALYKRLSAGIRNSFYGKQVGEFITLSRNIQVGDKMVDFAQMDTKGKMVRLSDFKGKLVLLEFWGSWCGPCRESNPELIKIYQKYKDQGFEIVGVAADSRKDWWLKAIEQDQLPWVNVCDLKGDKNRAAMIYGVSSYPTNFLIDRKGIIIAKNLRGEELGEKVGKEVQ